MKILDLIEPTRLDNSNETGEEGDNDFRTTDLVYLDEYVSAHERIVRPTDYAIMNKLVLKYPTAKGSICCPWLLRSMASDEGDIDGYDCDGYYESQYAWDTTLGIRPAMNLNIQKFLEQQKVNVGNLKINEGTNTLELGQYPKSYVGKELNDELERAFITKAKHLILNNTLTKTGKSYFTSRLDNKNNNIIHEEYEYKGEKYVRVNVHLCDSEAVCADGSIITDYDTTKDNYLWVKVEPIVWIITNWATLPKQINPNGTGTATSIELRTEQVIISGISFYPTDDKNGHLWQNSTIRGYLNGINVNNIKSNGNLNFVASHGGDFSSGGFLKDAFDLDFQKVNSSDIVQTEKNKEEDFMDSIFSEAQKSVEEEMER